MAKAIVMPKMGLTMTEGTIEEWKKKEGDVVKKGDILYSVSSGKLTNDIEANTDGILLKIVVGEGETAPCKAVVAYIGEAGEAIPDAPEAAGSEGPAEAPKAEPAAAAPARKEGARILASPAAKKLAQEKGVDLSLITGTGPNGRIRIEDVEGFLASGPKASPAAAKLAQELQLDLKDVPADGRIMKADVLRAAGGQGAEEVSSGNDLPPVKVKALRRSIAANMTASWHTSPRVTYTAPMDFTAIKELRSRLKSTFADRGLKLSYNHILMKAAAFVLTEFPDINASFADNMLTRHPHVNMGLAVAKSDGLIVPNVKCADLKSLAEISRETEALIQQTRDGTLAMDDMTGGTFTITNLGQYGITSFSPIINQPELAILGVCGIVDTPVVRDGSIVIRPIMNLSLTADHRVVDGVMAAQFLRRLIQVLEEPYLLLA